MNYREIQCNEKSPLFDKTGMSFREFLSDYRQIRYFTLLLVQTAPAEIRENNILEQQISELIKNAVKHGNKCDTSKKVRVWYDFSAAHAHLIIEDEGEGFKELEKWNELFRKRQQCLLSGDFSELPDLVFKGGDDSDTGTSLFTAVEYWNGGLVFNEAKNAVAVLKKIISNDDITEISEL